MITALFFLSQVWAQGLGEFPSYNLQWLRPSVDGHSFLWLSDSQMDPAGSWMMQNTSSIELEPLSYVSYNETKTVLIQQLLRNDTDFTFSLGSVRIHTSIPVVSVMANDVREFKGLGEIRTGIKYSITDQRNDKFGVALRSEVLTPTGDHEDTRYIQDEQASYIGELVLDTYKPGRSWGLNAGYHHRKTLSVEDITLGSMMYLKYGTALLFEESDVVFSAEVNFNRQVTSKQQALEVGAAMRLPLTLGEDLYLRGGINAGVLQSLGTPTIRGAVALQYDPRTHFRKRVYALSTLEKRCANNASIQCPDSDNDGIQDWIDICPLQPETINGITDDDGCPEGHPMEYTYTESIVKVLLNDVREEALDDPVSETEVVQPLKNESLDNTDVTEATIPDVVEERDMEEDVVYNIDISDLEIVGEHDDRDKDGIVDLEDLCIAEPEDNDGFLDNDGCPDNDNDEDGIPDKWDACPLLASLNQGGCPDENDEFFWDFDNDGIADTDDLCWEIPETINAFDDHDGCPDEIPSELVEIAGTVEGIQFRTGSARLSSSSNDTLRKVRKALLKYPQLTLSIEGHTDDVGKRERNIVLSEDRALAVEEWLLKKGIEKERISSVGYGPDKPIGDNETEKGRTENRRVEMLYRMNITDGDTENTAEKEGNEQENNETKSDKKSDTAK